MKSLTNSIAVTPVFIPIFSCSQNSRCDFDVALKNIPLVPKRPLPSKPWDYEPGIDDPILPEDPGEVPYVPDDESDEEDDFI
jgi:hypothetical protein